MDIPKCRSRLLPKTRPRDSPSMAWRRPRRHWRRKAGQPQRAALALVLRLCEITREQAIGILCKAEFAYRRALRACANVWWLYNIEGRMEPVQFEMAERASKEESDRRAERDQARWAYQDAALLHDRLALVCHGLHNVA